MNSMLFFVSTFFDYFGIDLSSSTCINSQITISNANFYIFHCFFLSLSGNSNGGALYCSSSNLNILIEECIFESCILTSGYGGAFYISITTNGKFIINKVCGTLCMSPSYIPFGYINYPTNSIINTTYLSISKSISSSSTHLFVIENSKINQKGFNTSFNDLYTVSGFTFNNPSLSNISYSTISNNKEIGYLTIYFHGGSGPVYFSYTNIINNFHLNLGGQYSQILWNHITFTSFDYCNFYLNTIKNLFNIYSGTVQVSNSWSDQFDLTGPTYINTNNGITLINNNLHYQTAKCFANNPISLIPSFIISLPRTYPENGCFTFLKNNLKISNLIFKIKFLIFFL